MEEKQLEQMGRPEGDAAVSGKEPLTLLSLFDGSGGFCLAGLLNGIRPVASSEIEPFPIRVTTKRMPWVKHYGDVSAINGGEIEPVDIVTFGSPCFPAGTLILTSDGLVPIEDVKEGMRVLTHLGRWRTVTAVGSRTADTVVLRGHHHGLECTPNHPIYSAELEVSRQMREDGRRATVRQVSAEKSWTPAEEMQKKLWAVPNRFEELPVPKPEPVGTHWMKKLPEFNEDFFYLVGRWLGDGWLRTGQRPDRPQGQKFWQIIICAGYAKRERMQRAVEAVTDRYFVEECRTDVKLMFHSCLLAQWLEENFGRYAWGKTIPAWAFSMPEEWRRALLQGILESDGCPRGPNGSKVTTVSRKLAVGIRLLGESLGLLSRTHMTVRPKTHVIEGRTVNQRNTYEVYLLHPYARKRLADDLHTWYQVKTVLPGREAQTVYNLTVEEDNSYTADGLVVHNCQDLSTAGKRAGLNGARSGLFFQAIRIMKEMREATNGKYPRYAVYENVSGLQSSNKGADFAAAREYMCSVKDPDADVPGPAKWLGAGEILGDDYSVARRVLDAQYWGVPQHRTRVFVVADFDGHGAGKILFESEGVPGDSAPDEAGGKTASAGAEEGSGGAGGYCLRSTHSGLSITYEQTGALIAQTHGHNPCVLSEIYENHMTDARYKGPLEVANTVMARYGTGGGNAPLVVWKEADGPEPIFNPADPIYCMHTGMHEDLTKDTAYALAARDSKQAQIIARAEEPKRYAVRYLMPVECARLQGFPDWWAQNLETEEPTEEDIAFWRDVFETHRKVVSGHGKPKTDRQIIKWLQNPHTDSAEYKMWGNGVALPCVSFIMRGIALHAAGELEGGQPDA